MESKEDPVIAIVGMACRFAQDATSPSRLWDMLATGQDGWSEIPESRFATKGLYHPNGEKIGSTHVKGGHFLCDDPALFDAPFFNLPAEVASTLDPQHRLTLEVVFEAMESAGTTLSTFQGSDTSVYAGCMVRDYHDTLSRDPDALPRYFMTGNAATMASSRVSHFYDLHGPSMTIDTGCSTTLTALHLACQSLKAGESGASIVTGASLMLNPDVFVSMSSIGFLSPDGKSYSFDHRANGYGRGEGVAAIVLKRLDDAIAAGDPVRAVIRGTALNQDGKTSTITTPSQTAQETLIRSCYRRAGVDPMETGYAEAHGTGTPRGDPIELAAIASALGSASRGPSQPLLVGSVKAAIGHTEAASGLASVIKVVMGLEKGVVPPNSNFQRRNPKLDLSEWNIQIPTTIMPWPVLGEVRRGSINNFGFGGANAHVIIEEFRPTEDKLSTMNGNRRGVNGVKAVNGDHGNMNKGKNGMAPQPDQLVHMVQPSFTAQLKGKTHLIMNGEMNRHAPGSEQTQMSKVFVLYARDAESCGKRAADLAKYLSASQARSDHLLSNLAYTLGERRSIFPWAAACRANSVSNLVDVLTDGKVVPIRVPAQPRIGFVFNGQGAQWFAMGRELIREYPVFRSSLELMDGHIREMGAQWSLIHELSRSEETTKVLGLEYSLPLCSAIQIALVDLLRSWGISPTIVTGHSSGEVGAAYAAHAIDARSAIAIPYLRGALSAETESIIGMGGMIAIGLGRVEAEHYISQVQSGNVGVACVNSQNSVTASGDLPAIAELEELLVTNKIFCRRLRINGAFHSPHMSPISKEYMSRLRPLLKPNPGPRHVIFSSSMTGNHLEDLDQLATPEYWNANMLGVVEFESSFRNMCVSSPTTADQSGFARAVDLVLEIGPHGSLSGPIQDLLTLPELKSLSISYLNCLVRKKDAVETMHSLACDLLIRGAPVNLRALNFPRADHELKVLHDLPPYAWAHNISFWHEPRINKAWRQRIGPSPGLLGIYQLAANQHIPTWRKILRLSELPWLRDHVIGSNVVYPGAGYLCMAVEAARVLCHDAAPAHFQVSGYDLRNVRFEKALLIPEMEGRELQLSMLSSADDGASEMSQWREFLISSVSADNSWVKHCHGSIRAHFSAASGEDKSSTVTRKRNEGSTTYIRRVDPVDLWAALHSVGISHGSAFQNINKLEASRDKSVATFTVSQISVHDENEQTQSLIHPTTLDSVFQAAYSALPGLGTALDMAFIPRVIDRMFLRHDINRDAGHPFEAHIYRGPRSPRSFQTDLAVFDADESSTIAVLEVQGLSYQSLEGAAGIVKRQRSEVSSTIQWEPDLSFATSLSALEHLKSPADSTEMDMVMKLRKAVVLYIRDGLAAMTADEISSLDSHYAKHYSWMKTQLTLASDNRLGPESSKWLDVNEAEKDAVFDDVTKASVNGEMIGRVGPRIRSLMGQEVFPLELMLEGGLLYRYYVGALKWDRSTRQIAELVRLLAHKSPRAKILEVGGGTGGGTSAILNTLGTEGHGHGGALFGKYDFTDVSTGFFEAARKRFEPWKDLMTFSKLDIEQCPAEQGFESGSYDIVVACQVLHATKSIDNTLMNVRRLLKPGGRLVLLETTQDSLDVFLAFGFLPGWWLSEEAERQTSPSLTVPFWDKVLRRSGFTGLDYHVRDCEDEEFYSFSVMMSTAVPDPALYPSEVVLVSGSASPPAEWLHDAQARLSDLIGSPPIVENLEHIRAQGKTCIFLGDLAQDTLLDMTASQFADVKNMISSCNGLLWITRGGALGSEIPEQSLSHGLLRSLRHEAHGKRFVTLDVSPKRRVWEPETVTAICDVFSAAFDIGQGKTTRDWEYCERDGVVFVPRLFRENHEARSAPNPTGNSGSNGALDNLEVPLHSTPIPLGTDTAILQKATTRDPLGLPPYCIELDPKAFRIALDPAAHRSDISRSNLSEGIKASTITCAGLVSRLGSDAASEGFQVGERVGCLVFDPLSRNPQTRWSNATHIPETMDFEGIAGILEAATTVYISMTEISRLQKGEAVMIQSAASELGQAAIGLCQSLGAEVYATVESVAHRQLLVAHFGIPECRILLTQQGLAAPAVRSATGGKTLDVLLRCPTEFLLRQDEWDFMGEFGRIIDLTIPSPMNSRQACISNMKQNLSYNSVYLPAWAASRPHVISKALQQVVHLYEQGVFATATGIATHPLSSLEQIAMSAKESGLPRSVVLTTKTSEEVPIPRSVTRASLRDDVSYLIVGGTGGIGRSLCEWMVERGAKHLILMSRNARLDEFLLGLDCKARAVSCDVSNEAHLIQALENCLDMPPIRGVFQAAMVLHDSVFEQMTLDAFKTTLAPKVFGTRNLHRHISGLDFFVMFSSILGITGAPGQSNYTASGAYQDALARFRRTRGLPAVSIDLSMVQSVGYVAGDRRISSRLAQNGISMLQEEELHDILDHTILAPSRTQIVTGIESGPGTDWPEVGWLQDSRFDGLRPRMLFSTSAVDVKSEQAINLRIALPADMCLEKATACILGELTKELIRMFGAIEIDPSKDLAFHGVDSLVAVEIRNWLVAQTAVELSVLDLIQSSSVTGVADLVAKRLGHI